MFSIYDVSFITNRINICKCFRIKTSDTLTLTVDIKYDQRNTKNNQLFTSYISVSTLLCPHLSNRKSKANETVNTCRVPFGTFNLILSCELTFYSDSEFLSSFLWSINSWYLSHKRKYIECHIQYVYIFSRQRNIWCCLPCCRTSSVHFLFFLLWI